MKKVLYLLGQLDDRDVEWMIRTGRRERLAAGTTLIREGQPITALYVVLDGTVAILTEAAGGAAIAQLGTGEVLGEISFVDGRPPSATARAATEAVVLAIPRAAVTNRLAGEVDFAARFYRALAMFLADRLRQSNRMLGFGQAASQRLAEEADEMNPEVLDQVHLAGQRFHEVLQRLLVG